MLILTQAWQRSITFAQPNQLLVRRTDTSIKKQKAQVKGGTGGVTFLSTYRFNDFKLGCASVIALRLLAGVRIAYSLLGARSIRVDNCSRVRLVLLDDGTPAARRVLLPVDVASRRARVFLVACGAAERLVLARPHRSSLRLREVVLELLLSVHFSFLLGNALSHYLVKCSIVTDAPSIVGLCRP